MFAGVWEAHILTLHAVRGVGHIGSINTRELRTQEKLQQIKHLGLYLVLMTD